MIEVPNAFTAEECQSIIDLGRSSPMEYGEVYQLSRIGKVIPQVRTAKIRTISPEECQWAFDRMWKVARDANLPYTFDELPTMQFSEYTGAERGSFVLHVDQNAMSKAESIRIITGIVQLSDPKDYEGAEVTTGETEMTQSICSNARGCAIFFPSTMLHQVRPAIRGVRYSLVAWFMGPNPRLSVSH
jgi:PKHD-type hydroxylase